MDPGPFPNRAVLWTYALPIGNSSAECELRKQRIKLQSYLKQGKNELKKHEHFPFRNWEQQLAKPAGVTDFPNVYFIGEIICGNRYRQPMKLRDCNVFSCVCQSVSLAPM